MKMFQRKNLNLSLASLALVSALVGCSASVDAPLAPIQPPAESEASQAIKDEPIKGEITSQAWEGRSALATIVSYADGTELLKIEIVSEAVSGCTKSTEYGWNGLVEIFIPIEVGEHKGSSATVLLKGRAAAGEKYSREKVVRVNSIEGDKVEGAIFAKADNDYVNGKFSARICPEL